MPELIYMDNAATTQVRQEVLDEMIPYFMDKYGNASSIFSLGSLSKVAIEKSREQIAKILNANKEEIYFTSGGSESDNWAIKGIAYNNREKGNHIITSKIEHPAVLNTCHELEKQGFKITYLDVDKDGIINLNELKSAIREKTILISIIFANNEIGTIMPIEEIGKLAQENNIYFHTDGVQAIGSINIDVEELNIDLLSMSSHKFYGPKGIGALYIRKGTHIDSLMSGGGQERYKRAGTENVPAIVGMGKAIELAYEDFDTSNARLIALRNRLINKIEDSITGVRLNGHRTNRLPGNVNFVFESIRGESLLLNLDLANIAASSGSACNAGALEPSHVLKAIGLGSDKILSSLRLSLGYFNTIDEVDYVVEKLIEIVDKLRYR